MENKKLVLNKLLSKINERSKLYNRNLVINSHKSELSDCDREIVIIENELIDNYNYNFAEKVSNSINNVFDTYYNKAEGVNSYSNRLKNYQRIENKIFKDFESDISKAINGRYLMGNEIPEIVGSHLDENSISKKYFIDFIKQERKYILELKNLSYSKLLEYKIQLGERVGKIINK